MTTESTTERRHAGIDSERGLLVAMATMVLLGVAALLFMVG